MKADKEFRTEFDGEYANVKYAGRKVGKTIIIWVIVLSVISTIFGVGFKMFNKNADRLIFKQSVTYNEGVLDDLAKYRLEMIKAEDDIEKNAIAEMVNSRFANYDESKIENSDLKEFLRDCRNMNLEDYSKLKKLFIWYL